MTHNDIAPTDADIDDIFDAYRLICEARNYADIPQHFNELMPGTQATIRHAAELRAHERNMQPAPRRARTIVATQRRFSHYER